LTDENSPPKKKSLELWGGYWSEKHILCEVASRSMGVPSSYYLFNGASFLIFFLGR
jgi:hypothetical protein